MWKDVAFMEGGVVNVGVEFESYFYDWIGFCLCKEGCLMELFKGFQGLKKGPKLGAR